MSKLLVNNLSLAIISISVFVICILLNPIGGFYWQTLITLIVYTALTCQMLHFRHAKRARLTGVAILLAPPIILLTPTHTLSFTDTLISLPSSLAFPAGALFGFFIYNTRGRYKFLSASILLGISALISLKGYPLWLNKLNYGTFSSRINEPVPGMLKIFDEKGNSFNLAEHRDEITVLDFWDTGCGICFKKFPLLEEKHNQYVKEKKIKFYSVNVPLKRDTMGQGQAVFKALKYHVPVLISRNNSGNKLSGVVYVPTVLVIYKERIVFRGDIENVDNCLNSIL